MIRCILEWWRSFLDVLILTETLVLRRNKAKYGYACVLGRSATVYTKSGGRLRARVLGFKRLSTGQEIVVLRRRRHKQIFIRMVINPLEDPHYAGAMVMNAVLRISDAERKFSTAA